MKFKLDENLPGELVNDLRAAGHEADTVHDERLSGADDSIVMARVKQEQRALLTMDKGIGNIEAFPPEHYAGIVLLRPASAGRGAVATFVRQHLSAILQCPLHGRLIVVSDAGIRIRR